jgi:hypothetical protein
MYQTCYVTVKVHKRARRVPAECDRTDPVTSQAARVRPYQPGDLDELPADDVRVFTMDILTR